MKKLAFLFLAVTIAIGFSACQTAGSTEAKTADNTAANGQTAVANPSATPAPQAAATPKKPDFQAKAEEMAKTSVSWVSEEFNYGTVAAGTKVTHQFRFKNTGASELVLTRVKASCGCTTPSYSQEPIAPGEEGYIDVAFNSAGKSGVQNKTVTVTGNFEGAINKVLRINGEVTKAEAQ